MERRIDPEHSRARRQALADAARLWLLLLLGIASAGAQTQSGSVKFRNADHGWTAPWIAAPWSTERDGAEADGSKPMPIFRREFVASAEPVSAQLMIAGLGQWSAALDGAPVIPGAGLHGSWTDYRKRVEVRRVDLTAMLHKGPHALTVMLGNGMYNVQRTPGRYTKFTGSFGVPKLTAELRLRFADGHEQIVRTDESWTVSRGPVVFSSIYGGEDFDARLVLPGWQQPNFHGAGWGAAQIVPGPGGVVQQAIEPDVVQGEHYRPVRTTHPTPRATVYDLGQNFAGVVRVHVQGPPNAVLRLTPGELLDNGGKVTQASSGRGVWWTYTLRGDAGGEDWQPQLGYTGFRFVQAEWTVPEKPGKILQIEGEEIRSAAPVTGSFASSDDTLTRIHTLIVHAMHNNEVSLFTDCPHREKLGWLEQTHLVAPGLIFNNDVEALFRETARNMAEAQQPNGAVPTIAPQYTRFGPKYPIYDDSPEWGSAAVLAPWAAYRFYGNKTELLQNYPMMQAWTEYLHSRAQAGIVAYGLGDWYDIGPKPPGFEQNTTLGVTGTLMLVECAQAMSRIATLLGKPEDATRYRHLAELEAQAFQERFWDAAHGWYDTGSQTANAMPLTLGIVPQANRARVLAYVIADIHEHNDHTTAGEIGFPYLLRALHQAGRDDVVLAMLEQPTPPSYAAQLAAGATALTEAWDANPHASQDHFMLGGAEEWLYGAAAGIDLDMSRARAAERITIRPAMLNSIRSVTASYRSALGEIAVAREGTGTMQNFDITVPVRSTVVLPIAFEGQRVLLENAGHLRAQRPMRSDKSTATFEVPAGTWHFRMAPPRL